MNKVVEDKTMKKLLGKGSIRKLDINLFENKSQTELRNEYEEKKKKQINKHIAGLGYSRDRARAQWEIDYPGGFYSWLGNYRKLTAYGQQRLIDKINEIIDYLNES